MEQGTANRPSGSNAPVIIDLGKKKRKAIKQLCKGGGKLLDEVGVCIQELQDAGTLSSGAQPVIVVVREKSCNRNWF